MYYKLWKKLNKLNANDLIISRTSKINKNLNYKADENVINYKSTVRFPR